MALRRVLAIAGGLEADQKVIAALGCYALTATTALTAQNTLGVLDIHHVPPQFVRRQIDAAYDDIGVDVVKTGMLASSTMIRMVAEAVAERGAKAVVVDPVTVATTGAELLPEDALVDLRTYMLPLATVLTPNVPEARLLVASAGLGHVPIRNVADLEALGEAVHGLGAEWVLLKGGHVPLRGDLSAATSAAEGELVVDVLVGHGQTTRIESSYQNSRHTHGTGCSLASAIACNLAKGLAVPEAVKSACRYVGAAIRSAPGLGRGNGPLNHFHSALFLPFPQGGFFEYLLARADVARAWHRYINHPFVISLGNGSLPLESFKGYLVQDYLYLRQFARANALAAYKSKRLEDVCSSAALVLHIDREAQVHRDFCKGFGLSDDDLEGADEHVACTAYSRYLLEIGLSEDWMALQVVLAPCTVGYGVIAKRLHASPAARRTGNPYWPWIESYLSADYVRAAAKCSELLEKHAPRQSPTRIDELAEIFIRATVMETAFWDMYPAQ